MYLDIMHMYVYDIMYLTRWVPLCLRAARATRAMMTRKTRGWKRSLRRTMRTMTTCRWAPGAAAGVMFHSFSVCDGFWRLVLLTCSLVAVMHAGGHVVLLAGILFRFCPACFWRLMLPSLRSFYPVIVAVLVRR